MTKIQIPLDDSVQLTDMPVEGDDYFHAEDDDVRIIPDHADEAGSPASDDAGEKKNLIIYINKIIFQTCIRHVFHFW